MTNTLDDVFDDMFFGCAFAAFVEQAIAQGGPPDREATRRLAYEFYEEALAEKQRSRNPVPLPHDGKCDT